MQFIKHSKSFHSRSLMDIIKDWQGKFDSALKLGHLQLSTGKDARVEVVQDKGIPFQLRIIPSLAKKQSLSTSISNGNDNKSTPTVSAQKKNNDTSKKRFNPFLPPDENLLVNSTAYPNFNVLFNKFCVVPDHLLLCSKEWRNQLSGLQPVDFSCIWNLLQILNSNGNEYLCFYNAGLKSGASQPHFHVQLLPVVGERVLKHDGIQGVPLDSIIPSSPQNEPKFLQLSEFQFKHSLALIPSSWKISQTQLAPNSTHESSRLYQLYRTCLETTFTPEDLKILDNVNPLAQDMDPEWPSFNFIMTSRYILIVPRAKEHIVLDDCQVSVNSVGMSGMILCKSEQEAEAIKKHSPLTLLRGLAYQS